MKRAIQIGGVILLLVLSVVIRNTARTYMSETYEFFIPYFVSGTLVIFIYQLCYWLIEKYDDLVKLTKRIPYFIGFVAIMLGVDFLVHYIIIMVVPIIIPNLFMNSTVNSITSLFMDSTLSMITSFLISTLIGNYILKRLLNKQDLSN